MTSQLHSILITGASSGLGAALARHYAKAGVTLWLTGRSVRKLEAVAQLCRAAGAKVEARVVDVTDAAGMAALIAEAQPLDLLIANAGISGGTGGGTIHGEDASQARRIFATNIDGVVNTVAPAIPLMAQAGRGRIALIGSLAGYRGLPSAPAYSASKAWVRAYAQGLRGWLGKQGVRVSLVAPGYIKTPMTENNPFPMPFLMDAEEAARRIARGLEKNKPVITFPLPLFLAMWVASTLLPARVGDFFFSRLPAKPATPGAVA